MNPKEYAIKCVERDLWATQQNLGLYRLIFVGRAMTENCGWSHQTRKEVMDIWSAKESDGKSALEWLRSQP